MHRPLLLMHPVLWAIADAAINHVPDQSGSTFSIMWNYM